MIHRFNLWVAILSLACHMDLGRQEVRLADTAPVRTVRHEQGDGYARCLFYNKHWRVIRLLSIVLRLDDPTAHRMLLL